MEGQNTEVSLVCFVASRGQGTERQRGIRTQRERCYPSILLYPIIPCVLLPSLCVLTLTSVSICVLPLSLLSSVTYSLPVFHCVLLPTFVSHGGGTFYGEVPYCTEKYLILRRDYCSTERLPFSPFYREITHCAPMAQMGYHIREYCPGAYIRQRAIELAFRK